MTAVPKYVAYRNKKILQAAKGEKCTIFSPVCNGNSETTVFCHSNENEHGKGFHKKSDDIFGFFGCSTCHDWFDDARTAPRMIKRDYLLSAMSKTWKRLLEKGVLR